MVAQLHLALVMAIDARLLVLDEPTLGLDILYRKKFYDSLLNDYFDRSRTIVVTTHQVEEIQDVLTDLMFIDRGRIVLECSMEEFDSRYVEVMVHPDHVAGARSLKPIHERQVFGRSVMLFENVDRGQLAAHVEARKLSIAGLLVAVNQETSGASYYGAPTRPLYWSVWRELWENRSIYIAPLIVAAVQIFGFGISTIGLAERRRAVLLLDDPAKQRAAIEAPYDIAAMMMIFTVFIVGVFYCLDALHGERRDRSILFWKSLPVSDLTTVLSKITIPLAVLPMIAFALTVCVQAVMILMTSANLLVHGMSPATTWAHFPVFQNWLVMLYGLIVLAL